MPDNQSPNQNNKTSKVIRFAGSFVVLGLMLTLTINIALAYFKPCSKVDPESLPAAHTWVWWATKDFLAQNPPADVVLLGSSLLMHPVSRQDADYLGKNLDYVHHHRSQYMESLLAKDLNLKQPICFNFALPGGMMSDDYIVAKALFSGQRKPKVIVLGLSVRDFIDSGVRCAYATPAFRYLKRFTDIDDVTAIAMPEIWQRFDYWIGNAIYVWGKKLDLQVMLAEKVKQVLAPNFARSCPDCRLNEVDVNRNMPSNLRAEVEEGMFIVASKQPYSYEDNSKEYRKRYRSPNPKLFSIQAKFMEKLMQLAKDNKIDVVIVNMPLTPENHQLMPDGVYKKYVSFLSSAADRWQVPFIDLDKGGSFEKQNFYDTAHMNSSGGKKLVDAIAAIIESNNEIASDLTGIATPQVAGVKENKAWQ